MLSYEEQINELQKEMSRRKQLEFIKYCWIKKTLPFIVGTHTEKICTALDDAVNKFRKGFSSFKIFQVPPRHGKSDIISRYFPPRFLGEFPEKEVIVVSHVASKAYEFSRFGRNLIRNSKKYQKLYPEISLSKDAQNVQIWELANGLGKSQYFGITSGIAGSGADCVIIDDYCKNREDAESEVMRDKLWNEFTDSIITRRHDPSITIILATRWHIDDIIGRYEKEMLTNDEFPEAEIVSFPAINTNEVKYSTGVLFPERFSEEYYKTQKGILSDYAFSALFQQSPILKGGNSFKYNRMKIIKKEELPTHRQITVIDLASSKVTRERKEPDWSVCMRGFMMYKGPVPYHYITEISRFRLTASKRDRKIKEFILRYNDAVYMEAFGAYKDSYNLMKDALQGIKVILPLTLSGDKEVKAEPLEAIFEAGNMHIVDGPWVTDLTTENSHFPSGLFDDQVDCEAMIYHVFKRQPRMRGGRVVI